MTDQSRDPYHLFGNILFKGYFIMPLLLKPLFFPVMRQQADVIGNEKYPIEEHLLIYLCGS